MGDVAYTANTYAGELYSEIIMPSLIPPLGIVDKGLVTPLPGIKKREVLRSLDFPVEFQDPACDFTDQNDDLTFDERYIDPVEYSVMIEMCYKDLKAGWDAMKLKRGTFGDYVPPADIESAFIELVGKKIGIMNEQLYIKGKAGVTAGVAGFTAAYPGLVQRLRNDSLVNKSESGSIGTAGTTSFALTGITSAAPGVVTVTSTANLRTGDRVTLTDCNNNQTAGGVSINEQSFIITVINSTTFSLGVTIAGTPATSGTVVFFNQSNAITVLSYVYNNMPETARQNPDTKIWIPSGLKRAYEFAQAAAANGAGSYYIGAKELDFLGNALSEVYNMPANTVIVAPPSNLFLGFDESGDETSIRVVPMADTTNEDKWRYKASMKTDVNHVKGGDILLVSPETAAGS